MMKKTSLGLILAFGLAACGGDYGAPSGNLPGTQLGIGQLYTDDGTLLEDVFEPNDRPEEAKRLPANKVMDLSLGEDGQDWFYLDLELGSEFIVDIEAEREDINLDVAVYYHDQENDEYIVRNQGVGPTGIEQAWWVVFVPVRYYVGVVGVAGATGAYQLKSTVKRPSDTVEKLRPVCGDTYGGFGCWNERCDQADDTMIPGFGNQSFQIRVDECSSCPSSFRIRARLDVPPGTLYELRLHDQNGNLVDAHTRSQGNYAFVTDTFDGSWGANSQTYTISTYFKGYEKIESCRIPWILEIKGGCPNGW